MLYPSVPKEPAEKVLLYSIIQSNSQRLTFTRNRLSSLKPTIAQLEPFITRRSINLVENHVFQLFYNQLGMTVISSRNHPSRLWQNVLCLLNSDPSGQVFQTQLFPAACVLLSKRYNKASYKKLASRLF